MLNPIDCWIRSTGFKAINFTAMTTSSAPGAAVGRVIITKGEPLAFRIAASCDMLFPSMYEFEEEKGKQPG